MSWGKTTSNMLMNSSISCVIIFTTQISSCMFLISMISPVLMTLRSWIRLLKVRQEMCEDPHLPLVGLNVSSYPTQRPVSCHFTPNSSFNSTYDWYTQTQSQMMELNQWCRVCAVVRFNQFTGTGHVLTWASPLVVALVLVFQDAVSRDTWGKIWHNIKT